MPELFLRAVLLAHIIASEAGVCGLRQIGGGSIRCYRWIA